jgi:hypothetical protein
MALADSGRAIGAVTRLLQDHLIRRGFEVSVGKPEEAAANNTNAKLNLFLYETGFDASLKNVRLHPNEPEPLWLALKYLLTAFDANEDSDSPAAHELIGRGISALHELNFLALDALVAADVRLALENNPEPLKLTFDETTAELISKIMQGTDERYRFSVAFQVRPVMIVPGVEPRYSLLVGVDYTTAPETIIGERGVHIDVLATLGPSLDRVEPARFETGAQIEIFGDDLGADLEPVLGDTVLTIVAQRPDRLTVTVEGDPGGNPQGPIASGTAISAGEHPLLVRRRLSPTRTRASNLLVARLIPTVSSASLAAGTLTLTGFLLGTDSDDIVVAFYQDGRTVRRFDVATPSLNQQTLAVPGIAGAVPAGTYRAVVLVNGQQANASPTVVVGP